MRERDAAFSRSERIIEGTGTTAGPGRLGGAEPWH